MHSLGWPLLSLVCFSTTLTGSFASSYGGDSPVQTIPLELKVDGHKQPLSKGRQTLPASHKNLEFVVGQPSEDTAAERPRVRYKLEPLDSDWKEMPSTMSLMIRFSDQAGDQVGQKRFQISGKSPGWNGSLETSSFVHRKEALTVPPHASSVAITVSSSGPPTAMGLYLVDGLKITRTSGTQPEVIYQTEFPDELDRPEQKAPQGWVRTGTHPSMAKMLRMPWLNPPRRALFLLDNDPNAHAEWRFSNEVAPAVAPKQDILLEWDEIYDIGKASPFSAYYRSLDYGPYTFQINVLNPDGTPTTQTHSIQLSVPKPYWKSAWFWITCFLLHAAALAVLCRWIIRIRIRKQLKRIHEEHLLERERLRIARDIHDDLGARLTHISLVSACAENTAPSPETRKSFQQISGMTKELVVALYETVWTVNPENDRIDALIDFLCQLTQNLCQAANVRCRLFTPQLDQERRVTSELRHHIILSVKEAVNNAIKHGSPTELELRITLDKNLLSLTITDNGRGFPVNEEQSGRGLKNMKHRMDVTSGKLTVNAAPSGGVQIHLEVPLP